MLAFFFNVIFRNRIEEGVGQIAIFSFLFLTNAECTFSRF